MNKNNCSRTLPKPIKIWSVKGRKTKLKFVIYPRLEHFKAACKRCRFLEKQNGAAGSSFRCRLDDPDFLIKFYERLATLKGILFVGIAPSTIKSRYPELYGEIVTYLENRKARSFRTRVSSGTVPPGAGQTKPELADGIDVLLVDEESNADRSEGVEKPLELKSSLKIQAP